MQSKEPTQTAVSSFNYSTENAMKQLATLLGSAAMGLVLCSSAVAGPSDLYGEAAPNTAAERTVVIDHDTQYVNVTGGDVVRFVVHGQDFTWNFDTAANIGEVDLNKLLPSGLLHHTVKVYVERDPDYDGA